MKKIFEKIGLSRNEGEVYFDLIKYGESTPVKVSERTGISRENVYFISKGLEKKSLIEILIKKGKQSYKALNPKNLKGLLEEEKVLLTEKERVIESVLPELNNVFNLNESTPSVSFFKGINGIKEMYEDIYRGKKPEEVIAFRSIYDDNFLGQYAKNDLKRLSKEEIPARLISSPKAALPKDLDKKGLLVEEKIIQSGSFDLPAEIGIYNNKVLIASFKKDKVGAIIEGKEIADSLRMIFNHIWEKD